MTAATARPIYKRFWDFLGSRDSSVFIFVMGMTYFLILAIFGMVVPLPGVTNISKLLPYKVLYILFFINLLICEIKWIPVIIRRCRKPSAPETADEMERFGHKTVVSGQWSVVSSGLEKYLRRRGYRVQSSENNPPQSPLNLRGEASHVSPILYAHKGRFSPIGNLLFHISFLFLLIGVGLSILYRFDGTLLLAEGQGVSGGDVEYLSSTETELMYPPEIAFEVEKVTPAFWKERLLFTELRADVSHNGRKGVVRLSQPFRIDGTRVTIIGMGVTPLYLLKDEQGRELDSAYVNLSIFMPGSKDQFRIPDSPYMVRASFYPDFELKEGRASTRSMNLLNPTLDIRVFRGSKTVFKGLLKRGEEANFDGLSLSFPELKYSGIFRVVYDRGFIFIWTGFILMIAGLVWRLVVYRKEIVVLEENGKITLVGRSDYYQNLFNSELGRLAELS